MGRNQADGIHLREHAKRHQRRPATIARPPVAAHLLWFWLALLLLAGLVALVNRPYALALAWGSSVNLLPGICFAWYSFRTGRGARHALATVNAFYRAEAIKFLLTAVLFAAVFVQVEAIHLPTFFLAFLGAQAGSWWLSARVLGRPKR